VAKPIPVRKKKLPVMATAPDAHSWAAVGFDISMSNIWAAAFGWDNVLKKYKGPVFAGFRWERNTHYFERLRDAVTAAELVWDTTSTLGMFLETDQIYIAQEEPFPPHSGFLKRAVGTAIKQQAEISGAFLGGLLKAKYTQIYQMGNTEWRKMVADEIRDATGEDVTTHHTKFRAPWLAEKYNCAPINSGKFRSKQWALEVIAPWVGQTTGIEIPDWPDIISSKHGSIPRPETSRAKAIQPDDRYDALGVCWAMWQRLKDEGVDKLSRDGRVMA
jgi:hypothetical protein